jgi:mannan endo-1,4-beta-mannosidase
VEGGINNAKSLSHINKSTDGGISYNEALWADLDRGIAIAADHGLRIIIPLVDNWRWFGGAADWARLSGTDNFWTDEKAKILFKGFISWLLERENTVTGLKYKDDPTILCWELGNELESASDEWLIEIAAFIRRADDNHLIMDGGYKALRITMLECPYIDIVTTHYRDVNFDEDASEAAKHGKAYIYGEFDPSSPEVVELVCSRAYRSGASGAMAWSLRFHTESGGFYYHRDFRDSDSLQYPGFASTRPSREKEIFSVLRKWVWRFRGFSPPEELPLVPPVLFPIGSKGELSFRGSTGAEWYDLEYAPSSSGPWEPLLDHIDDSIPDWSSNPIRSVSPLFVLNERSLAKPWYRIVARSVNISSYSEPVFWH